MAPIGRQAAQSNARKKIGPDPGFVADPYPPIYDISIFFNPAVSAVRISE